MNQFHQQVRKDQNHRQDQKHQYDAYGRWVLAGAVLAGWGLGLVTELSELLVGGLFAFLAGSIVLNVLKEELPAERESTFWAFAVGVLGYAALMLVA